MRGSAFHSSRSSRIRFAPLRQSVPSASRSASVTICSLAVRASAERMTEAALDALAQDLTAPIAHLCLRAWRDDLPTDMAALRRPPHESRADSVMYLEVLAAAADRRGWQVHTVDAKTVEAAAAQALGPSADLEAVLAAPRTELGPPWSKEHRMALAATIVVTAGG